MTILIIGGTSSVGLALKNKLSKNNHIITAGRNNCDISLDLNDISSDFVFPDNIDIVIHTAAYFGENNEMDLLNAETINVLGTVKVCQAASKANVKHFMLISSIFSLVDKTSRHYSPYTISKRQSEEVAEFYCNSFSLPIIILRPSQIYGNYANFKLRQPFLNHIIEKAKHDEEVNIYGSKDPKINIIHMDDLVNIIALVIEKKIIGIYPCTGQTNVSYTQFAKAAFVACDRNPKIYFLKDRPDIMDNIFPIDCSLYEKISYYPQISLENGVKEIINNYIS
jgi:nucleoside-diphosphate-sugar epimerase